MSKAKVDKAECARLYLGNWSVSELAEHFGCNESRIRDALRQMDVPRRDERRSEYRQRSTHCAKGMHEFTEENTRVDKNGGRHCRQCERDYSVIRYYTNRSA